MYANSQLENHLNLSNVDYFQQVKDFRSFECDLEKANRNSSQVPIWTSYSFKEKYELADLSPWSLDKLIRRFSSQPKWLKKYRHHYYKGAGPSLAATCDAICYKQLIWEIATTQRCLSAVGWIHPPNSSSFSNKENGVEDDVDQNKMKRNNTLQKLMLLSFSFSLINICMFCVSYKNVNV